MLRRVFKKNMIIFMSIALLCAGIISVSFIYSSSKAKSFDVSGYVHVDTSISESKKLYFSSGTKIKPSINNQIQFSDVSNEKRTINYDNFIHYDDNSLAALKDGVIVDIDTLNTKPTINHYHIVENLVINKQGEGYSISTNGNELNLSNFIWKISENKYLIVSPNISTILSEFDIRDSGTYAEVTYLDGNIIQIQTSDNLWQTISTDSKLQLANGYLVDIAMKNIKDPEENVLIDFNEMIIDSDDNVEVSPLTEEEKALKNNIIPHFTVNSEQGDSGANGTTGLSGLVGSDGNYGNNGLQGAQGSTEDMEDESIKFPVFTINDWTVSSTGCSGSITIKDEDFLLQNDNPDPSANIFAQLYLVDLESGTKIYKSPYTSAVPQQYNFKEVADSNSSYEFSFTGLKTDHSYLLYVSAPLKPDSDTDTYSRGFISKTFWTDSLGIYMETKDVGYDYITMSINRDTANSSVRIFYPNKLYDNYETVSGLSLSTLQYSDFTQASFSSDSEAVFDVTYQNAVGEDYYSSNKNYYGILAYDIDLDGNFDDYSIQIFNVKTLKRPATVGSPILRPNRNNWGFDITPGAINDPDGGIVSFKYEFYNSDQFDSDNNLLPTAVCAKSIETVSSAPFVTSLDGVNLLPNKNYRVRVIATFDDNTKVYTIPTSFSNEAQLDGAQRPRVYFEQNLSGATSSTAATTVSPYYDTITGILHINPGTDGSKLLIDSNKRRHPAKVKITDNSTYTVTYDILPIEETSGKAKGSYLLGVTNSDGDVTVAFNDYENDRYSWVSGLKKDKDYEFIVTGDLSEDGSTILEENAEIGKCVVRSGTTENFTIYSSYNYEDTSDTLKNVTLAVDYPNAPSNELKRQRNTLYAAEIRIYSGNVTSFENSALPTPVASKVFTKEDEWVNNLGQQVFTYYDYNDPTYQNGVEVVEINNGGINNYYLAEFGVKTATDPISDGGVPVTPGIIDNSSTKQLIPKSKLDQLFESEISTTTLADGTVDYKIDEGGLTINSIDFGTSQKAAIDNIIDSGCTLIVTGMYDYTYNSNDSSKLKQDPSAYYINSFDIEGESKIYIQFSKDISNIITSYPFSKLIRNNASSNYDYSYLLQANFSNSTYLAESITYYVYDAVDFYKGTYTRSTNSQLIDFANTTTASTADDKSYILRNDTFTSPVLQEGLELGKVTIDFMNVTTPSAVFYPYSKEEYASKNHISPSSVPTYDSNGNAIIYFNTDNQKTYGHQYVFCWTINYHAFDESGTTGEKLVYPFDASVNGKLPVSLAGHPANTNALFKFSDFIGRDNVVIDIEGAYHNNGIKKYGKDAYMLIPHTLFTSDTSSLCDEPIPSPSTYAIQHSSTDEAITMKTFIVDSYKAVYQTSSNTTKPYLLKSVTGGINVEQLDSPVKINTGSTSANSYSAMTSLVNYGSSSFETSTVTLDRSLLTTYNVFSYNITNAKGDAILLIPIQLYVDKYTTNNTPIHSVSGNNYVSGSLDGNWIFSSNSKMKYQELLTASFLPIEDTSSFIDGAYYKYTQMSPVIGDNPTSEGWYELNEIDQYILTEDTQVITGKQYYQDSTGVVVSSTNDYDNPKSLGYYEKNFIPSTDISITSGKSYYRRDIAVELQSSVKVYLRPNTNAGKIVSYFVHVSGPKQQLVNAIGIRLIIGNKLKIDKYLVNPVSTKDYASSHPEFVDTKIKEDASGNIDMFFMLDVEQDLSSAVPEFGNPSYSGQSNVTVSAKVLYETNEAGYGLLNYYTSSNNNYYSRTNNITLGLKSYRLNQNTSSGISYLTQGTVNYLAFTNSLNNLSSPANAYPVSVATGSSAYKLERFGSFLQMYGRFDSSNRRSYIQVRPTRYWNTGNPTAAVEVNPNVRADANISIPFKVVEGGSAIVKVYDTSTSSYSDDASLVSLTVSQVDKSISNYHSIILMQNANITYQLHGTVASDVLYFTITQGNRISAIDETQEQTAYVFNPEVVDGETHYNVVSTSTIPANSFNQTSSINNPNTFLDSHDAIKKSMISVNGTSNNIILDYLPYTTGFTVTCWQWTEINTGQFGFKKLKMDLSGSEKIDNFYSFETAGVLAPTVEMSWKNLGYDNKYLSYGVTSIDSANFYYVVDLCDSAGGYLTHLFASDSSEIQNFDADSLNLMTNYRYIYKNDYAVIEHNGNNIKFGPDAPDDYKFFRNLEYGKTYKTNLRLYLKGTGPAWDPSYDYGNDYDNVLNVFKLDEAGIKTYDPVQSQTVIHTFYVSDQLDMLNGNITSLVQISGSESLSYIQFTVPSLLNKSYSLRYERFTPVVIREHVNDDNSTSYFDITKDIITSDNKTYDEVNGVYSFGQNLRINTSELNATTGTYVDKYTAGDVIHIFIYAYQDDITSSLVLESTNILSNLTAQQLLDSRYTVKPVNSLVTPEEYSTFATPSVGNSRFISQWERTVKPSEINAGKVRLSLMNIGPNTYLNVNFNEASGLSAFKKIEYQITVDYYVNTISGRDDRAVTSGLLSEVVNIPQTSSPTYPLDINNFLNNTVQPLIGDNGDIIRLIVNMNFYDNKDPQELISITPDPSDPFGIVSPDFKHITYTIIYDN